MQWFDTMDSDGSEFVGLLAVLVAVACFGSWGVPVKLKRVRDSKVDTVVFHAYSCAVISVLGLGVLVVSDFVFSYWGIVGAIIWMFAQIGGMNAVILLGYAVAAPIIAGLTIICAFFWGVLLFQEQPVSLPLAMIGILLICVGMGGVGTTSSKIPDRIAKTIGFTWCTSRDNSKLVAIPLSARDDEDVFELETNEQNRVPLNDTDVESPQSDFSTVTLNDSRPELLSSAVNVEDARTTMIKGIMWTLITGLTNGSLMVPFSLYRLQIQEMELELRNFFPNQMVPNTNELSYLLSFSIGIFIVAPSWLCVYHLYLRQWPDFKVRAVGFPATLTGFIWFTANIAAIYATKYLGSNIGYPLTQTGLLVSALWSVLFFKEIRGFGIVVLFVSAIVLLGGATLLAMFGKKNDGDDNYVEEAPPL